MKFAHEVEQTPGGEVVVLRHDCEVVGNVELADDWRFCPWCGSGCARAQSRAQRRRDLIARKVELRTSVRRGMHTLRRAQRSRALAAIDRLLAR